MIQSESDENPKLPVGETYHSPKPEQTISREFRAPDIRLKLRFFPPAVTLVLGMAILLFMGFALLLMPICRVDDGPVNYFHVFFTASSAITVTGLVVVETSTYWTFYGQAVICLMILIGGLGWMTFAGSILAGLKLVRLGPRISISQRLAFQEAVGASTTGETISKLRDALIIASVLQLIGGLLLSYHFKNNLGMDLLESLWHGFFQAISAFNNAGFTTIRDSNSLSMFSNNYFVLIIMGSLIMLGGLGFQVMRDLLLFKWVNRVHVDTKIVVTLSVILWVLGSVVILALENNSSHFQAIPLSEKIINSSFQSVTARAAGFSTIPFYEVVPATSFIVMLLMFIGTASASTGGGIRLNTLGILLSTALASVRGREHVTCFRREIDSRQVNRAITITFFASALVFTVAFILSFTEQGGLKFIYLLFEVCSAVGTVGLSSGITPGLSAVGQIMIIITMFAGRLIPLVLGLSLIDKERKPTPYRYPQERVRIG